MESTDRIAKERARMPEGTNIIINSRSLAASHKRLASLIEPGMKILDIGCGSGAITCGIAEKVGRYGKVIGIDSNVELIREARKKGAHIANLSFEVGDIYSLDYKSEFDIVTCSRVLQWLSDPQRAIQEMAGCIKENGRVVVLDYNHEKIEWRPQLPESMQLFYQKFLKWRNDAGMNNRIADNLVSMFKDCGLTDIDVSIQNEETHKRDEDFIAKASIWADVAAGRGHQLVKDNYISERERNQAETDYRKWVTEEGTFMSMYLLAVTGKKGSASF
ncbi:methyltransferase domain-containing protein [Cohnella sp. GbtcB17]|uniref:methyltransferase domain-containing protein n=1 Tax=Cohnella sp. GbtcB17 TaxID=2824762 RepID=UPI001C30578F|nr:methyltransferase domain-containing protein [Cohnella sp. GbtcB17]